MPESLTPGPDFLKEKYSLQNSPGVARAAGKVEIRTSEKLSQKPAEQIQTYLDRLTNVFMPPKLEGGDYDRVKDYDRQERNLELLRPALYDKFVIKPDSDAFTVSSEERMKTIVEAKRNDKGQPVDENNKPFVLSHFDRQQIQIRGQGHGLLEITPKAREKEIAAVRQEQQESLDKWIDYLASPDVPYPDWLRYYAFRSVVQLGPYNKKEQRFGSRKQGDRTTAPFVDLNREVLALVLDALEKKYQGGYINLGALAEHDRKMFDQLLESANFGKLWQLGLESLGQVISEEDLKQTDGQWVTFPRGQDVMANIPEGFDQSLVQSIQGKNTGWCIAGESVARSYSELGDFHLFYTPSVKVHEGKRKLWPRIAIRMEGDKIAEVRGIAEQQNLDPYSGNELEKELKKFGKEGETYIQKVQDMKRLTLIEIKMKQGEVLVQADLVFLYELDRPIQGFGYEKDPRIAELLKDRDSNADAVIVFGCEPSEIAHTPETITDDTKAYVGLLVAPGIFDKIAEFNIEHIYTKFPEGKIQRYQVELTGQSGQEFEDKLQEQNIDFRLAKRLLESDDFKEARSKISEEAKLVCLTIADLGFSQGATTDQIFGTKKHNYTDGEAYKLGLELCPPEIGPQLRLQPIKNPSQISIAMKGAVGSTRVFYLKSVDSWLKLATFNAPRGYRWLPKSKLVFRLRK